MSGENGLRGHIPRGEMSGENGLRGPFGLKQHLELFMTLSFLKVFHSLAWTLDPF